MSAAATRQPPTRPANAALGPPAGPLWGHLRAFQRDRLAFLTRLAAEHGDVARFRIGPYRVWQLAHPDLVREVLVEHADRFRKSPVLRRARLVLGDGLLTAEGDTHRRHRSLLQAAFHPRRVAGYADTMVARAAEACERWQPGEPLDVHAETVRTTLTVAGETLLGTDVEADVDAIDAAIADLLAAYRVAFVPFGWQLQRLPVGPMRRLQRGRAVLDELVSRMIAARRADPGDDLLSALVDPDTGAEAGAAPLSDAEIRDEAVTLLLAGHETTASALAFAFHLLASHPDVERRLHAEVDAVLGRRRPTVDDLARLPVAHGVIGESLRLYPPSWAMGREAVAAHPVGDRVGTAGAMRVGTAAAMRVGTVGALRVGTAGAMRVGTAGALRIEPGDPVVVPQWVVHRDPRWWPDPHRCEPDRWSDEASRQRPRGAFFAFGGGGRQCVGERFAWTEGVLALATIASRWRLEPIRDRPLRLEPLITLRPRDGLWLRPVPRSSGAPDTGVAPA